MKLDDWNGKIYINGELGDTTTLESLQGEVTIHLVPKGMESVSPIESTPMTQVHALEDGEYFIHVKGYMLQKSTPSFDFMERWNNNVPMPLSIMAGIKDKETPRMVHMKLHGAMYAEQMHTCMKCGRPLTNPVSQYFGIGPECGHHGYTNPFESEEELRNAIQQYRVQLLNITWEGWIPKSAILEEKAV